MSSVKLRGVRKSYGHVEVIKGVDLDIAAKEFVVFVGPSGCGKSTLLRLIAGLEDTTSGQILLDGEDMTKAPPARRGLAMVFQSYALYPHMTVRDNIAFPLKMAKAPKEVIDQKVEYAARTLNLSSYLDRRPRALSGGQRQRVAIGRAIVREPKAFLFDEPLSNLDAALRVNMRLEITELHQQLKTTMIYVTHDQVEAMTMADRIAVLADGRLQQVGEPQAVYERPANLFVASFIGSPPMNTIAGTLSLGPGAATVATAVGAVEVADPGTGVDGAPVVVGVRPEHLDLAPVGSAGADGAAGLEGTVENVELLGHERHVVCRVGESLMTLRHPNDHPAGAVGERVRLVADPKGVHLFDARTTERLN